MRAVAQFEAKVEAERFGSVLYSQGIDTRIDKGRDGKHTVWVYEESYLDAAKQAYVVYSESPNDPRIKEALRQADERLRQTKATAAAEKKQSRHKEVHAKELQYGYFGMGPVTFLMVATCVVVYVLIEGFGFRQVADALMFAKRPELAAIMKMSPWEATDGEVWRFVTPALMHASAKQSWTMLFHIIFNMWWMKDLGTAVERFHSSWVLIALVLVSAVFSNTLQYVMVGPFFVGMSGVVFALFGFLWIRPMFDPWSRYRLPGNLVVWMLLWFAAGWLNFFPIANWAHGGGLVVGVVWGFLSAKLRRPPSG